MIRKIGNLAVLLMLVIASYYAGMYTILDGKENFSFASVTSNTDYPVGYSDVGYLLVKNGDTENQVIDKIGKPFNCYEPKENKDTLVCVYGRSDRDAYRARAVVYDKNKIVINKGHGVIPD